MDRIVEMLEGDDFYRPHVLPYRAVALLRHRIEDREVPTRVGQPGMYTAAADDLMCHPDDKPTIGLLLCKTKNNVVTEYALRG